MKARLFVMLIIMLSSGYLIFSMAQTGEVNRKKESARIKEVIDKALVQCYALEGSYPPAVDYLTNYGVIIDNEKYYYHYDMFASNIKPTISIILR